jgi:DNA-binding NarL/FixJ family response regulator
MVTSFAQDNAPGGFWSDRSPDIVLGLFGLARVLDRCVRSGPPANSGMATVEVDDPAAFIDQQPNGILLVSLLAVIEKAAMTTLAKLHRPSRVVVYLDTEKLAEREMRVLSILEGTSVIGPTTDPEDFVRVVRLARSGISCVPDSLRRRLAAHLPDRLDHHDVTLLLLLTRGASTALVAEEYRCSGAQAECRLLDFYGRLGVSSTAEAVAWARRHGFR